MADKREIPVTPTKEDADAARILSITVLRSGRKRNREYADFT